MSLQRFTDRAQKDQDFSEEIESHLAHEQDANQARGLAADEARRQAHLRFGNPRLRHRYGAAQKCALAFLRRLRRVPLDSRHDTLREFRALSWRDKLVFVGLEG